ncbi:uncharacterized protein LOC110982174 [Acanthaster planci]|uniref:receptor protein-tyrosine kinase n=1 Tax=Acanthaster planci TaxID=133434 RepID=A0A8B7YTU4_ACAPL|nr:uncharacterized protein LOC110982174 [Acanthaster planci]
MPPKHTSRPGVNPSVDFTNHVIKTLAMEILGYQDVRILNAEVDFHNSTVALQRISGCYDYSCRAIWIPNDASNATINMEVWQDNLLEMALWSETGTIKVNGFLGYTARYGWFVSQTLVAEMWEQHQIIADHWKSLHSQTVIRKLLIPLSELQGLVTIKSEKPWGKETRYYCERAECIQGMYIPPVCQGTDSTTPTAECPTLVAGYPDTSFDMLIGQIVSLRLPVVVAWIGPQLESYISTRSQTHRHTLFLSWSPHALTSSGLFNRVSFPTCVEGVSIDANSGCDFRTLPVSKVTWLPLAHGAPDLDEMISAMSFSDFEMQVILRKFYHSSGNMEAFACDWLKSNTDIWNGWLPNQLNPRKKIYLGGLFPDHIPAFSGIGIGAKLAVEAVNTDSSILTTHELELVVDGSDGSDAVASYLRLQKDNTKPLTGVIGPMHSEDCKIIAPIAALFRTVVISYGVESPALSNRDFYPNFVCMLPSAAENAYALARLFETYSWKRYAAISDSEVSSLEVMTTTEGILGEQGITLVASQSFTDPLLLNPALFFDDIKNQRAHLVVGLFSDVAARVLLCEAYKQDVTGYEGYQWFLPALYPDHWWDTDFYNSDRQESPESVPCTTQEMARAVAGYMSLSQLHVARGEECIVSGETAAQWEEKYQAVVDQEGKQASDFAAYAYDAVWAFALAYESLLQKSPGALGMSRHYRDISSFMSHLSKTRFLGMTGEVTFAGSDRQGPVLISQHLPQRSTVSMPVGLYIPFVANSSEWTGTLQLNTSDIVWLNDGKIPDDGGIDEGDCAVESFRVFLGVDCQSATAILNAFLIIVVFIILVVCVVLVKKAYNRKVKKAGQKVKDLGITALGQSTLLSLNKWEVAQDNVILNRKLGEGAFGTVYGGEAMLDGNHWVGVAVKTLKVESTIEEKLDFLSEAEMMKRFDHKNIVKLLGVCTRREPLYTIMDFMLHGDLKTFLLARRHLVSQGQVDDSSMSPERLTSMVLDVATGVSYLAANKYVHRSVQGTSEEM